MTGVGRDPARALVQAHLRALDEQLRGAMDEGVVRAAVDELMRFQAVFSRGAAEAVSILRQLGSPQVDAARLARVQALALERFEHHRGRLAGIRAREPERSRFVAQRAAGRA